MKISQREARRLRKRVNELERARQRMVSGWGKEWPDSAKVLLVASKGDTLDDSDIAIIRTSRMLGHPVVVTQHGDDLTFYGVML